MSTTTEQSSTGHDETSQGAAVAASASPSRDREAVWERRWRERLDALVVFHRENGRLPRRSGAGTDEERRLGVWLRNQLHAARSGTLSAARMQSLRLSIPQEAVTTQRAWEGRLEQVVAFHAERGRLPRQSSPAVPRMEGALGSWLSTQRRAQRSKALSVERQATLDELVDGWLDGLSSEAAWRSSLEATVQFAREHGRLPRHIGRDLVEGERSLGGWMHTQRHMRRIGRLTVRRQRLLNAELPSWLDTDVSTQWQRTLREVAAFHRSTGRLPRLGGRARPHEVRLGKWLSRQRTAERQSRLSVQRRDELDSVLPGWVR